MGARGLVTAVFSCTQLMFTDPCACWALLMPKLGSEHGRVRSCLWGFFLFVVTAMGLS